MKKYLLLLSVLCLIILHITCQFPVDSSVLPDGKQYLVIDVALSETYGKLSVEYSLSKLNDDGGYQTLPKPKVENAYIKNGQGEKFDFYPDGSLENTFVGVVGETYQFFVEIDGKSYTSALETMRPCPEIDSLVPIFTREDFRNPTDLNYHGFDVTAYLTDTPISDNYYQWSWIHYERATGCGLRKEPIVGEVQLPCQPFNCFNIVYSKNVIVQSDELRDGQSIAKKIVRVPFITPPSTYFLRVEQRSITPRVYAYLQSIEAQTEQVGTLFDLPATTKFSPNISNIDNPNEAILGVFNVFSSKVKNVSVDRRYNINGIAPRNIPDPIPFTADPFASAPCIESKFRTLTQPDGWIE